MTTVRSAGDLGPLVLVLVSVAVLAGACGRGPARREPTAAVPVPVAGVPDPAADAPARRGDFAYAAGTYRYEVVSEASVELLRDSVDTASTRTVASGVPLIDTVTTVVHLTYRIVADSVHERVAGTVDSFTVRSTGLVPVGQRPLAAPLPFQATLDAGRDPVRFEAAPDTACAAPDAPLLTVARDLLIPLAPSLAPGTEWRDTVVTSICRAGVPVTSESVHSYRVAGPAERNGTPAVRVTRTTALTLRGAVMRDSQTVTVAGTGSGNAELFLDAGGGRYLGGTEESRLELSVTNGVQSRRFLQNATMETVLRQ